MDSVKLHLRINRREALIISHRFPVEEKINIGLSDTELFILVCCSLFQMICVTLLASGLIYIFKAPSEPTSDELLTPNEMF